MYDFAKDCLTVRMEYFGLRVRIQDVTGKCVASSLDHPKLARLSHITGSDG